MTTQERLYTVEEFEAIANSPENSERLLELVNGEIVEKPMPELEHGNIAGNIYAHIWNFNQQHRLGRAVLEVRYKTPGDSHNSRIPDVSFSTARVPLDIRGAVPQIPKLAIEVKSPDDSLKELREKAHYFVEHGAEMFIIIVSRPRRYIEVYAPDYEEVLLEDDNLTFTGILTGLVIPVRDIFADPLTEGDAADVVADEAKLSDEEG